jgi:hypothetical protein
MSRGNILQHGYRVLEYSTVDTDEEVDDTLPEINLNTHVQGKFQTSMTNILSKHCSEIKTSTDEITQVSVSKKKLKELINKHNNEIFSFLSKPDKTPQVLGIADTVFRRYGHELPTIKGNSVANVLRDLNLDVSMNSIIGEFNEGLKKIKTSEEGGGSLSEFMGQMKWLLNQYKVIGEEILRIETVFYQKLQTLDKLNNRIPLITSLGTNEALPELVESFTKYVNIIYEKSQIEIDYRELVELYKKWNICRQIISQLHTFKETHEPQCSICINDSVSYVIVPCGHTFCSSCSKKQNTTCYICRSIIRERVKLFFT